MRLKAATLLGLGLGALLSGLNVTAASAQNYPWCAHYSGGRGGGGENCGFSSFRQCQEDISGIGGFCERNTQYMPHGRERHYRYR